MRALGWLREAKKPGHRLRHSTRSSRREKARRIREFTDTPNLEEATAAKRMYKKAYERMASWFHDHMPFPAIACIRQRYERRFECQSKQQLRNVAVHVALLALHVIFLDESVGHNVSVKHPLSNQSQTVTHLSMFFLMSLTSNTPLLLVALMTSAISSECPIVFLAFITLTTAA